MLSITGVVLSYYKALADNDGAAARRMLESLEDEAYQNEADWKVIAEFLKKLNLDARLEVITRRLIARKPIENSKVYFVLASLLRKSGHAEEIYPLIKGRKLLLTHTRSDHWEFLQLLFSTQNFSEYLEESEQFKNKYGADFPLGIMEAKTYWMMGERRIARTKLRGLNPLVGQKLGNWIWYSNVAADFGERKLAEDALVNAIRLIDCGVASISREVVEALNRRDYKAEARRLIGIAKPQNGGTISEYLYIYKTALDYGYIKVAQEFGKAILHADATHELRSEIEGLAVNSGFLTS